MKTAVMIVITAMGISSAANAGDMGSIQQPAQSSIVQPPIERKATTAEQAIAEKLGENATLSDLPELQSYKGVNLNNQPLQAGSTVYNEVTRSVGKVTGNITVLLSHGSIYDLAETLKLNVTYFDERAKLGQLSAAGQHDILAILDKVRRSPQVASARLDIAESRNRPQ
ncbi:hypothetical protein [Salinivibrio proteolyticus]|uniref:hypothetical protein n=1 Tax=Salinivibrio proteolyticus TaxID=334715 RepID=UPI0009894D30|nr:hypothetical protein [Salinivibrio proteolyticus]OOF31734.1 hypothetical protein BZJ20_04055 [Salinivibrio proteolyticus]